MRAYRSRLRQAMSVLRTGGGDSSSWPTLTTANNLLAPSMQRWPAHRRLLPTLTAQSYGSTNNGTRDGERSYKTKGTPSLEAMAKKGTLLPTLTASEGRRGSQQHYARGNPTLTGVLLPTLTASSATRGTAMRSPKAQGGPSLQEVLLPTLCARDSKGPGPNHTDGGADLPKTVGGHLSPTFCEWFMGYPIGWTEGDPRPESASPGSETPSSPTRPKSSAT